MRPSVQATPQGTVETSLSGDCESAINSIVQTVVAELHEGIRHGHFELTVSGARVSGCLQVILKVGKSHRFVVPAKPLRK
jgi:hypothetical protein